MNTRQMKIKFFPQIKRENKMVVKIRNLFIVSMTITIMMGCMQNNPYDTNLNVFHPNVNITIDDVIDDMKGCRLEGIDMDVFEFIRSDTIIRITFSLNPNSSYLCYEWEFPIPDSIPDSIFLDKMSTKYNVIFDLEKKLAYCFDNKLTFFYYLGNWDKEEKHRYRLKNKRYFWLCYNPSRLFRVITDN